MKMRALTVSQPFSWAIITGLKPVENRSWATNYRGPLVIHAGTTKSRLNRYWEDARVGPNGEPAREVWKFGAALGIVDLVDCVPLDDLPYELTRAPWSDFNPCGPWCWVLANPRPFATPITCKGALKFWTMDVPTLAYA